MVTIKMLGNYHEYEVGKEYKVDEAEANALTGMGLAIIVEDSADGAEVKE